MSVLVTKEILQVQNETLELKNLKEIHRLMIKSGGANHESVHQHGLLITMLVTRGKVIY